MLTIKEGDFSSLMRIHYEKHNLACPNLTNRMYVCLSNAYKTLVFEKKALWQWLQGEATPPSPKNAASKKRIEEISSLLIDENGDHLGSGNVEKVALVILQHISKNGWETYTNSILQMSSYKKNIFV